MLNSYIKFLFGLAQLRNAVVRE